MKKKIIITDNTKNGNGKKIEGEVTLRNEAHFEAQRKFKANKFIDRKKRAKKGYIKHKGQDLD